MSVEFVLKAEPRTDVGKGASRRLRRSGRVPAVIYGGHKDPESLSLPHNELIHQLDNEAIYSSVLKVVVNGRTESAVLRDLQRHPYKPAVLHVDLQRIRADEEIKLNVPLHFLNEESCHGVKQEGGMINKHVIDVEVLCLPSNLPEYIEVDLAELKVGEALHLSQLTLPANVVLVELAHEPEEINDIAVVSVHHQHSGGADDDEEADDAGTAADSDAGDDA